MKVIRQICFYSISASFLFGLFDRFTSGDLFSFSIAAIIFLVFLPLCPNIKEGDRW